MPHTRPQLHHELMSTRHPRNSRFPKYRSLRAVPKACFRFSPDGFQWNAVDCCPDILLGDQQIFHILGPLGRVLDEETCVHNQSQSLVTSGARLLSELAFVSCVMLRDAGRECHSFTSGRRRSQWDRGPLVHLPGIKCRDGHTWDGEEEPVNVAVQTDAPAAAPRRLQVKDMCHFFILSRAVFLILPWGLFVCVAGFPQFAIGVLLSVAGGGQCLHPSEDKSEELVCCRKQFRSRLAFRWRRFRVCNWECKRHCSLLWRNYYGESVCRLLPHFCISDLSRMSFVSWCLLLGTRTGVLLSFM